MFDNCYHGQFSKTKARILHFSNTRKRLNKSFQKEAQQSRWHSEKSVGQRPIRGQSERWKTLPGYTTCQDIKYFYSRFIYSLNVFRVICFEPTYCFNYWRKLRKVYAWVQFQLYAIIQKSNFGQNFGRSSKKEWWKRFISLNSREVMKVWKMLTWLICNN